MHVQKPSSSQLAVQADCITRASRLRNHYGATADGLVLGYRAGAKLLYADTLQYHPTGAAYPEQIFGALVTEKVRSLGAKLINVNGEAFMHPLETRDVSAASIIRECSDRGKRRRTHRTASAYGSTPR